MNAFVVVLVLLVGGCKFHAADEESYRPIGAPRYDAPQPRYSEPVEPVCLVVSQEQAEGRIVSVEDGGTLEVIVNGQVVIAHLDGVDDTEQNYSRLISRVGDYVYMDVIYRISATHWVVDIPAIY